MSFKINCTGLAVVPPLMLSSAHIKFPVTAFNNRNSATVFLKNTSFVWILIASLSHTLCVEPRLGSLSSLCQTTLAW
jgi:hypothetical protein